MVVDRSDICCRDFTSARLRHSDVLHVAMGSTRLIMCAVWDDRGKESAITSPESIPGFRPYDYTQRQNSLASRPIPNRAEKQSEIDIFYYYEAELRSKKVHLNVAERDFTGKHGNILHERFLYSITDSLK